MTSDIHHLSPQEWSQIFSGPLNPSLFQALAANGVLPAPDHPRPSAALPPSLWMSAASPSYHQPPAAAYPRPDPDPVDPVSPSTDSKSTLFTDIFSDDLFPQQPSLSPQPTSPFTSPRVSGSPLLNCSPDPDVDPEQLAKDDPLATQVWKMYARTKVNLPHAQRMENITWRMMALALKKKKEEDDAKIPDGPVKHESTPPPLESSLLPDQRGRRIDKGKARVRVVGFDALQPDSLEDNKDVIPMDWRAMSRSRSRLSMDWRPTSRSRSRPPESTTSATTFDQHGVQPSYDSHFAFPTNGPIKSIHPLPTSLLSAGRRSPPFDHQLGVLYESQNDSNHGYFDTTNDSFPFHNSIPSSLPTPGLHGFNRHPAPPQRQPDNPQRTFPRFVRKTSFDHTVNKDGINQGPRGRHQYNGKPIPVDILSGTKRPADALHTDSFLRADPSNLDNSSSSFPSSSFNFSFPPYDGVFDLPPTHYPYQRNSNRLYHSTSTSSSEGLSAAAVTASAVMAEGYAQLNAVDENVLDYRQLMNMVYPTWTTRPPPRTPTSIPPRSSTPSTRLPVQALSHLSTPARLATNGATVRALMLPRNLITRPTLPLPLLLPRTRAHKRPHALPTRGNTSRCNRALRTYNESLPSACPVILPVEPSRAPQNTTAIQNKPLKPLRMKGPNRRLPSARIVRRQTHPFGEGILKVNHCVMPVVCFM
ncbi:hypothetical protein CPB84DRAFT_404413 [Gymnopilus junonius]|uniref:Nitrogen regulatory protein areA GATA-like domain-containing protein n=1 Tax=Gymnopilus junonius TaxID=109634 RepID=A0A9P5TRY0_GYMJU|nr:hypothetical protein CPB84DRAFT_404413 [Gymnopilus junonius]